MSDPGAISKDRGFKALFATDPVEAIAFVAPDLLARYGTPVTATLLQQESHLPDLAETSRFHDVALALTWADVRQTVILLIEQWSRARSVDLGRVLWHIADLVHRHPHAVVCPVMLVTDSRVLYVADRWIMTVVGRTPMMLQVQVYRVTSDTPPRLRSMKNRVAAILTILDVQNGMDAADAVGSALEQMARSPGSLDDIERFLPFALTLANMLESDMPRIRRRLEEAGMINVITDMKNEARAEALIQSSRACAIPIPRFKNAGVLTRDAARAQVQEPIAAGAITREIGNEALAQLE